MGSTIDCEDGYVIGDGTEYLVDPDSPTDIAARPMVQTLEENIGMIPYETPSENQRDYSRAMAFGIGSAIGLATYVGVNLESVPEILMHADTPVQSYLAVGIGAIGTTIGSGIIGAAIHAMFENRQYSHQGIDSKL